MFDNHYNPGKSPPKMKHHVPMPPVKPPKPEKQSTMTESELIALALLANAEANHRAKYEVLDKVRAELTLRGIL